MGAVLFQVENRPRLNLFFYFFLNVVVVCFWLGFFGTAFFFIIFCLTAKEYAVLEYLMRNRGRVLTRTQIADHVWNYDFEGNSNIVDVYIRYLRRKIDDGFEDKLIQTVRGSGYMMRDES